MTTMTERTVNAIVAAYVAAEADDTPAVLAHLAAASDAWLAADSPAPAVDGAVAVTVADALVETVSGQYIEWWVRVHLLGESIDAISQDEAGGNRAHLAICRLDVASGLDRIDARLASIAARGDQGTAA
jgi:hypothetical protein